MADPVLIRFLPDIQGKRNFKAPSGQVYRFGSSARERYVLPQDVDFFVQRADFALVQTAPTPPSMPPVRRAEPSPPKEEKDLTDVVGIGPASARKLKTAGITTIPAIMDQTPEDLAKVLGFSLERTRKIIQACLEHL